MDELTPRETDVWKCFGLNQTATVAEVADSLYISESTVKTHLRSLYKKKNITGPKSKRRLINMFTSERSD